MVGMGYNLEEIQDSLAKMKYDEITATYLLLGRKASEVDVPTRCSSKCLFPRRREEIQNGRSERRSVRPRQLKLGFDKVVV